MLSISAMKSIQFLNSLVDIVIDVYVAAVTADASAVIDLFEYQNQNKYSGRMN